MTSYVVVAIQNGWRILGSKENIIFQTKSEAVAAGKKIAHSAHLPLIVKNKSGVIESVSVYNKIYSSNRLLVANVKNRINSKKLRKSIAQALLERQNFQVKWIEIFSLTVLDEQYQELFDALLFAVYFCRYKPRCALEIDNGAQIRLEKIFIIIKDCDLGVHDISRTQLTPNNLPRFNMPLEFGIFLGAKKFGSTKQKQKSCMIFDSDKYRYMEFMSDIAGQDIKWHNNDYT